MREAHAELRGWVANLEDGTVEAMIQAPARRSTGCSRGCATAAARVTEVTFEERKTEKRFERFQQQ